MTSKIKNFFEDVKDFLLKWFCYCHCCFDKDDRYEDYPPAYPPTQSHQRVVNNQYKNYQAAAQTLSLDAIQRVDVENKKFAKTLKKQGHRCVYVYETIPTRVGWCQRDKCVGPNYFD